MSYQVSGVTVIDANRIGTFTALSVAPKVVTFSPADEASSINTSTNIIITFDQLMQKGTGNITLRTGSSGGGVQQTIAVSSASVTISANQVTIDPPSNISAGANTYVVIDAGAFCGITTNSTTGVIENYNFTTQSTPTLGTSYEGGFVICLASPIRWVVSPYSTQVSTSWYGRAQSNTNAQQASGCTGWFVPLIGQLQNPGFACRTYWGTSPCFDPNGYWSNDQGSSYSQGCMMYFAGNGHASRSKSNSYRVRSFRCVTY
jgi:hypothetical protein